MARARRASSSNRTGFTLIEASLAIIIVGLSVTATMQVIATGTRNNIDSQRQITADQILVSGREMTLSLTPAAVRALDGQTFSPPVDAAGQALSDSAGWAQRFDINPVKVDSLSQPAGSTGVPHAWRVTVTALRRSTPAGALQWLVME